MRLSGLSAFLDDLDLGNEAEAFVAADDRLIGFPDHTRVEYGADASGNIVLPTLGSLASNATMALAQDNVVDQVGDDLVYRSDIAVSRTVNWTLVLRAPVASFTESADAQQSNVLGITLASSVVFLLSLVLLIRITKPIASLAEQATTDPLTGLSNRRHISSIGQTMLRQLRRDEHLFVLVIDLDNFKQLNDSHGHHMGDHALALVAEQLGALTRRGDLIGRLGGDEFVVALPSTELASGIETGRRIITRLSDALTLALPDSGLGVTGGLNASVHDTVDFEDLLIEADQALITAKIEAKGMLLVSDRLVDSSL